MQEGIWKHHGLQLHMKVKEDLSEQLIFFQRLGGDEGGSHVAI